MYTLMTTMGKPQIVDLGALFYLGLGKTSRRVNNDTIHMTAGSSHAHDVGEMLSGV